MPHQTLPHLASDAEDEDHNEEDHKDEDHNDEDRNPQPHSDQQVDAGPRKGENIAMDGRGEVQPAVVTGEEWKER